MQPVDTPDGYLQAADRPNQYRAALLCQPVRIANDQSLYDEVIENSDQIIDQGCENKHQQQVTRHESSVQHTAIRLHSQSAYRAQLLQQDEDQDQQVEDQEQSNEHVTRGPEVVSSEHSVQSNANTYNGHVPPDRPISCSTSQIVFVE